MNLKLAAVRSLILAFASFFIATASVAQDVSFPPFERHIDGPAGRFKVSSSARFYRAGASLNFDVDLKVLGLADAIENFMSGWRKDQVCGRIARVSSANAVFQPPYLRIEGTIEPGQWICQKAPVCKVKEGFPPTIQCYPETVVKTKLAGAPQQYCSMYYAKVDGDTLDIDLSLPNCADSAPIDGVELAEYLRAKIGDTFHQLIGEAGLRGLLPSEAMRFHPSFLGASLEKADGPEVVILVRGNLSGDPESALKVLSEVAH